MVVLIAIIAVFIIIRQDFFIIVEHYAEDIDSGIGKQVRCTTNNFALCSAAFNNQYNPFYMLGEQKRIGNRNNRRGIDNYLVEIEAEFLENIGYLLLIENIAGYPLYLSGRDNSEIGTIVFWETSFKVALPLNTSATPFVFQTEIGVDFGPLRSKSTRAIFSLEYSAAVTAKRELVNDLPSPTMAEVIITVWSF